jgi:glycosyltransferase involved in cell wall biosynthesis
VATRIAGHADAVVDGVSGVLADIQGDVEANLADALVDVLDDPRRLDQLRQGALARAAALTWDQTATQVMRILATEVSRRRGRA